MATEEAATKINNAASHLFSKKETNIKNIDMNASPTIQKKAR